MSAAVNEPLGDARAERVARLLDDAYNAGGWTEARRYAITLEAAARAGVLTTLAALDSLVEGGIPYKDARELVDRAARGFEE